MDFKRFSKLFVLVLFLFVAVFASACKPDDEEFDFTDLSVRDFKASNGVVTAANPYAAMAGLKILQEGGNAFDAAVAVSFALGVVEPNASGIGGGGIMVAYDATNDEYVHYNMREFVPEAGSADVYGSVNELDYGARSVGVPTQVIGLLTMIDNLGSGNVTRQEIMAPAISYAKDGFPVTPQLAETINGSFNVIQDAYDEVGLVFTSENAGIEPMKEGELLVQADYGNVLQRIADEGATAFYTGEVAQALVNSLGAQGLITLDDLRYAMNNYPKIGKPNIGTYNGYDIISSASPSSGGIILIETLNLLEQYGDLSRLQHNSAEYINVVGTAMQLAYGDKQKYIGDTSIDPETGSPFVDTPVKGLTSKAYAAERWQQFVPGQAYLAKKAGKNYYGNPLPYNNTDQLTSVHDDSDTTEHYSTTAFSVADKDGNIVSITQTINHFFGAGIVPHGCGFFLNNQLSSFSIANETYASYVKPYKQPVSHIMPTIIMKDGVPFATLGSPGSTRIPSAVIQVVLNMIVYGMDIQSAIASPRFYCYSDGGSDEKSGKGKTLYCELGIPESVRNELAAMNYMINIPYEGTKDINLYFGGVQGITFKIEDGVAKLHGGADPRRDGKAVGF